MSIAALSASSTGHQLGCYGLVGLAMGTPVDSKRFKLASLVFQQQQGQPATDQSQQSNGFSPRLADENNYMLKPGTASTAAAGEPVVIVRQRSASLSFVTSRLTSSPGHHRSTTAVTASTAKSPTASLTPARSQPPTPPPHHHHHSHSAHQHRVKPYHHHHQLNFQPGSGVVAAPASSATPYARLLCSCAPTCCCHCSLLSSIAECQSVYHHVCADFVSSDPAAACSAQDPQAGFSPSSAVDVSSPPHTIHQDVVSPSVFFFLLLNICLGELHFGFSSVNLSTPSKRLSRNRRSAALFSDGKFD